jgi:hypothetical protein
MNIFKVSQRIAVVILALGASACVTHPPTIAHVHMGHAITGVHVTPNQEGYFVTAEKRAREAARLTTLAHDSKDLSVIKTNVAAAVEATDSDENFGLKHALIMASNHISFAATSADASANLQQGAPVFAGDITREVERCELITLLGKDVQSASTINEASILVVEIDKLTKANVDGDDANNDGVVGSVPAEYGIVQLRKELDGLVARENPPYRTVDQWYLFNLVKLPNGRWVFDRFSRGGNIEGYK